MASKRESALKSDLRAELKRQCPSFIVLAYATAGAPDLEVIGHGITTRWEFKHGTPAFDSPGNQELICQRLAAQGHCRYIFWQERRGVKRTLIVHPREVAGRVGWDMTPERWSVGYDHQWLVAQIREAHGV